MNAVELRTIHCVGFSCNLVSPTWRLMVVKWEELS